jgi:hypothetical protein
VTPTAAAAAVAAAVAAASLVTAALPPQVVLVFDTLSINRLLDDQSPPSGAPFSLADLQEHLHRTSLAHAPLVGLLLRLLERAMALMQDRVGVRAQRNNCMLIVNRMWTAVGLNAFTLAQPAHYQRLVDAGSMKMNVQGASLQMEGVSDKEDDASLQVCAAVGPLGQLVAAVAAVVRQVQRCTPPTPGWLARFLLASGDVRRYVALQCQLAEAVAQCAKVVSSGSGQSQEQMQHAAQVLQEQEGAHTCGYKDEPPGTSDLLKRNARQGEWAPST